MKLHILVISLLLQIFAVFDTTSATWTVFVSEDGTLEIVDLDTTPEDSNSTLEELKEAVEFWLYTNANTTGQQIYLEDDSVLESSGFNSSIPTRIVIHGWQSSGSGKACTVFIQAYLGVGDYNVIAVDWSAYAAKNYLYARTKIVAVGEYVGLMIDYLAIHGMDLNDLTVIGHSLGAHIAGNACRSSLGTVGILIGLDPAGPLFGSEESPARMRRTDAAFVQVIHTNAGWLGHDTDLGIANIWVNGGSTQTGCTLDIFAHYCDSQSNYSKGYCATNGKTTLCGVDVDTSAIGKYYVATNSASPYATGL